MKARVGDRLMVRRHRTGDVERHAEVLEVRGEDGAPPYLVRWSDGHESILVPGSETTVEPPTAGDVQRSKKSGGSRRG
jgi:Domain of unknown function (DUF1918)